MCLGAAILLAVPATAQVPDAQPATPSVETAPAPPGPFQVVQAPAGTIIAVELTEALSSRSSKIGQMFGLRLAEPIFFEGKELVPAGAVGGGEVVDAHASAFGGRQGRLILSARFLEINGERIGIRGMQLTAAGKDRVNGAIALSMIPYAGVASIFVHGGEVDIPAGARGTARLTAPLALVSGPAAQTGAAVETIAEPANPPALPVQKETP